MDDKEELKRFFGTVALEDVLQFRVSLDAETDRGCALMAAAHLEDRLEDLVRMKLVDDAGIIDRLFDGNAPLATFSAKIDIAYSLGLIAHHELRDLTLIRRIRNEFAHSPKLLDFDAPQIASRTRELYHDYWQESLPPRKKFTRVICGLLGRIEANAKQVQRCEASLGVELQTPGKRDQGEVVRMIIEILNEAQPEADQG